MLTIVALIFSAYLFFFLTGVSLERFVKMRVKCNFIGETVIYLFAAIFIDCVVLLEFSIDMLYLASIVLAELFFIFLGVEFGRKLSDEVNKSIEQYCHVKFRSVSMGEKKVDMKINLDDIFSGDD